MFWAFVQRIKKGVFLFLLKSAVKTDEAMLILKSKTMTKRNASSAFNYACTVQKFSCSSLELPPTTPSRLTSQKIYL